MGVNTIGFAFNSKIDRLNEITDKLNIVVEGPIEESYFENAISSNIHDHEIFLTKLEKGTLIIVGTEFPFFGEDFSILSEHHQKFSTFIYGDTSGQFYFEYYENGECRRRKLVSEGDVQISEGNSLPIEFAGLSDDELVMDVMLQTCGENIFTIEPNTKSIKYRYISGKPNSTKPKFNANNESIEIDKQRIFSIPESKNRIVFFLVLIHIFLGISNMITSNLFLNTSFLSQIPNYITLMLFGIMGYFLLKRKNWMRIVCKILYFVSIPLTLISLKLNALFLNNLIQFLIDTMIILLLLNKGVKELYTQKRHKTPEITFEKISIKEVVFLILGVCIFQIGAADVILKIDVFHMGFFTGILSGIFIVLGIYLVRKTLKNNYYS